MLETTTIKYPGKGLVEFRKKLLEKTWKYILMDVQLGEWKYTPTHLQNEDFQQILVNSGIVDESMMPSEEVLDSISPLEWLVPKENEYPNNPEYTKRLEERTAPQFVREQVLLAAATAAARL